MRRPFTTVLPSSACHDQREHERKHVEADHGQALQRQEPEQERGREERGDDERVDGKARRAGHERHHQHRQQPIALSLHGARGQIAGTAQAKAGQHRHEGAPVQAERLHHAVHQCTTTRAMYPESSSRPMKKNSNRIWGRRRRRCPPRRSRPP